MRLITFVISVLLSIQLFATPQRDPRPKVINGTNTAIKITYSVCIFFESKNICSADKTISLGIGEMKIFDDYPNGFYEIKIISNGIYTRVLGTQDEPKTSLKKPTCHVGDTVITQYSKEFFCERIGV